MDGGLIPPDEYRAHEDKLVAAVLAGIAETRVFEYKPYTTISIVVENGRPTRVYFEDSHKPNLNR